MLPVLRDILRLQRELESLQQERKHIYETSSPADQITLAIDELIAAKVEEKQILTAGLIKIMYSRQKKKKIRKVITHRYLMSESWKATAQAIGTDEQTAKKNIL